MEATLFAKSSQTSKPFTEHLYLYNIKMINFSDFIDNNVQKQIKHIILVSNIKIGIGIIIII